MLYYYVDCMIALDIFSKNQNCHTQNKKITRFSNFESKLIKLWDIFQPIIYIVMLSEIFTRAFKSLKLIELSIIKKSSKLSKIATIFEIYNGFVSLS